MKIGIITVFLTENCGSVLQAMALSAKIKQFGHEVLFIDTRNKLSGHSVKRLAKSSIQAMIKKRSVTDVLKKYKNYEEYLKVNFNIASSDDVFDLVVVGSDTVWDVTAPYFMLSQDVFWFRKIKCKSVGAYAVSIANSTYDQLDGLKYPADSIKRLKYLSARDMYTKKYMEQYTSESVSLVCDPTLLHDKDFYRNLCKPISHEDYILLYLFDEPDENTVREMQAFAAFHCCKIISMVCLGKHLSCADIYVEATIDNFLSYFNGAKYVLTNTFHGTVFSVIFNKQFVTLDYKKTKIYEFLKEVNLLQRLTRTELSILYEQQIDYEATNRLLCELRTASEDYLKEMLRSEEETNV